jgi:hypothetical protein
MTVPSGGRGFERDDRLTGKEDESRYFGNRGSLPILYTNCESCDAWMLEHEDWPEHMMFAIREDG